MVQRGRASHPFFNGRQDEDVSKPEIRLGNDAGLVRRGSRTARNEGAASGAPYANNLGGGHFEIDSDACPTDLGRGSRYSAN